MTNSIYEKIESIGQLEADRIYAVGEEKAKALAAMILDDAQIKFNQIINKNKERNDNKIKTKVSELEQLSKQRILVAKKKIIEEAFNYAVDKLNQLSDDAYIKLIVKLLQSEKIRGDEVIQVAEADFQRFVKLFSTGKLVNGEYILDKLNVFLKQDNFQIKLAKQYANINGGFIIISKSYDIDYSFQAVLQTIKEKLEAEIANLLFDGE